MSFKKINTSKAKAKGQIYLSSTLKASANNELWSTGSLLTCMLSLVQCIYTLSTNISNMNLKLSVICFFFHFQSVDCLWK